MQWKKSCPPRKWKAEFISNETGYVAIAKEIAKQRVEGSAWFLLAYSKMGEERDRLRKNYLTKRFNVWKAHSRAKGKCVTLVLC